MIKNYSMIGTKLVYQIKLNEKGTIIKNNAILVGPGYSQNEGIDYEKTFPPVERLEYICILLAYTSFKCFKLFEMDMKKVFLDGFIKKEVFI